MSALQRQSYANQFQPLFLQDTGEEDNLTLKTLTIQEGGEINISSSLNQDTGIVMFKALNGSTFSVLQQSAIGGDVPNGLTPTLFDEAGDYDILQARNIFVYGGGAYGTNNYVSFNGSGGSFGLSYGDFTNPRNVYLDTLETGVATLTNKCIGPNPVNIAIGAPFSIAPVPTAPTAFDYFGIGSNYPTTSGREYDVYAMGTFTLASGTPDATIPDIMAVSFSVGGTTTGLVTAYFNPETGNWFIRARLISTSSLAGGPRVGCQNTQKGTSTAVYDATCSMADIVRVA